MREMPGDAPVRAGLVVAYTVDVAMVILNDPAYLRKSTRAENLLLHVKKVI
jgi:hypothetical protein